MNLHTRLRTLPISARTFLLITVTLTIANFTVLMMVPENSTMQGPPPLRLDVRHLDGPPPPAMRRDPGEPRDEGTAPPPEAWGAPPPKPPGMDSGASRLPTRIAEILALEALILIPFGWLFSSTLSTPLRRFAAAAALAGHDATSAPVAREGPIEVISAVDAFNTMQANLKRLLKERTQMVGAIAHDLRTPLTRLAFRLDDLPEPLGDKVRHDLDEMKTMIAAALDFIRDDSLRTPFERLDLRLLIERVAEEQSDLGRDVTLVSGIPVTIEGSPLSLRRAIGNLIDNAVKYGERARISLGRSGSQCIIEVDDDGPGVPETLQSQVFDPFFRIEGSRNRHTGGIGLGLATTRAIVVEHGGDIMIANRKPKGLRVSVYLPIAP